MLDPVQARAFAAARRDVAFERGRDRRQFVFAPAHLLGEILKLALARDLRGDATAVAHQRAQLFRERNRREFGFAQRDQLFRQIEHGQGLASQRAATRGFAAFGFGIMHHVQL